jgi:DNA-binding IclR family transcriptional regulator
VRERDKRGRFAADRDPADVLAVMEPMEPYKIGEVIDETGWPRRTVYQVLDELADEGKIRKKKPNATTAIWIRVEGGETA